MATTQNCFKYWKTFDHFCGRIWGRMLTTNGEGSCKNVIWNVNAKSFLSSSFTMMEVEGVYYTSRNSRQYTFCLFEIFWQTWPPNTPKSSVWIWYIICNSAICDHSRNLLRGQLWGRELREKLLILEPVFLVLSVSHYTHVTLVVTNWLQNF